VKSIIARIVNFPFRTPIPRLASISTSISSFLSHSGPFLKRAIISDQGFPWRSRVINLAEVVGRCNVFFVKHAVALSSKESLDSIIIGDFEGGSGKGS
jgi:hypothetical protein